mmetsp:Transcript_22190/g.39967  ORF Transcript_22190/g.39967 Transcript_22190/m.39967 type:complete len:233 (-) Transcript_22190:28-726(-)
MQGGVTSEEAWRKALKDYEGLSQGEPRPEADDADDASEHLLQVRRWALSLSVPRMARGSPRAPDIGLELPPLRIPALARKADPEDSLHHTSSARGGNMDSAKTLVTVSAVSDAPVFDMMEDPIRPWPPKVSQLGKIPRQAPNILRGLQSKEAMDAAAKAQARVAQRHQRRHLVVTGSMRNTASNSSIGGVADPMAGSLFSRDVVLDRESQRRGLYEGQLRQANARSGSHTVR